MNPCLLLEDDVSMLILGVPAVCNSGLKTAHWRSDAGVQVSLHFVMLENVFSCWHTSGPQRPHRDRPSVSLVLQGIGAYLCAFWQQQANKDTWQRAAVSVHVRLEVRRASERFSSAY